MNVLNVLANRCLVEEPRETRLFLLSPDPWHWGSFHDHEVAPGVTATRGDHFPTRGMRTKKLWFSNDHFGISPDDDMASRMQKILDQTGNELMATLNVEYEECLFPLSPLSMSDITAFSNSTASITLQFTRELKPRKEAGFIPLPEPIPEGMMKALFPFHVHGIIDQIRFSKFAYEPLVLDPDTLEIEPSPTLAALVSLLAGFVRVVML